MLLLPFLPLCSVYFLLSTHFFTSSRMAFAFEKLVDYHRHAGLKSNLEEIAKMLSGLMKEF